MPRRKPAGTKASPPPSRKKEQTVEACQNALDAFVGALWPFAEPVYEMSSSSERLSRAGMAQLKETAERIHETTATLEYAEGGSQMDDAVGSYVFHVITLGWLFYEAIAAHTLHPEDGEFQDAAYRLRCMRELALWTQEHAPAVEEVDNG